MATYRYRPEAIEPLSLQTQKRQSAFLMLFVAVVCAAGFGLFELQTALIYDTTFLLIVGLVMIRSWKKTNERIAGWIRSAEIEIDDEAIAIRNATGQTTIGRAEVAEIHLSSRGVWLSKRSQLSSIHIPPEVEKFDELSNRIRAWIPPETIDRTSPPSALRNAPALFGLWVGAPVLLYLAMASQFRPIAIPACVFAGIGLGWYLAWSGQKSRERLWRVLLPLTGYLVASALLLRAYRLWIAP